MRNDFSNDPGDYRYFKVTDLDGAQLSLRDTATKFPVAITTVSECYLDAEQARELARILVLLADESEAS